MGKRTTTRHKEDNTFKYETFSTKLSKIDANVSLVLRDTADTEFDDDDGTTHLFRSTQINAEKNNAEDFLELVEKINPHIRTLEQILHEKQFISSVLLTQLDGVNVKNTFKETTELIVALAKDLKSEFESDLPKFVAVIRKVVLNTKDTEILEPGFKCLGQLFRILRNHVVQEYKLYLKQLVHLWDPKKSNYLIVFSAQTFAVVSRKFWKKSPKLFFKILLCNVLKPDPQAKVGVQALLLEMMKGIDGGLDFSGKDIFRTCLESLEILNVEDSLLWADMVHDLIKTVTKYFVNEHKFVFAEILESLLESQILKHASDTTHAGVYLMLYRTLLTCSPEIIEEKSESRINRIATLFDWNEDFSRKMLDHILCITEIILKHSRNRLVIPAIVRKLLLLSDSSVLKELERILIQCNYCITSYIGPLIDAHYELIRQVDHDKDNSVFTSSNQREYSFLQCMGNYIIFTRNEENGLSCSGRSSAVLKEHLKSICQLDESLSCCKITTIVGSMFNTLEKSTPSRTLVNYFLVYGDSNACCCDCRKLQVLFANKWIGYLLETNKNQVISEDLFAVLFYSLRTALTVYDSGIMEELFIEELANLTLSKLACSSEQFSLWVLKLWDNLLRFTVKCTTDSNKSFVSKINAFLLPQESNITTVNFWQFLIDNLRCRFRVVRTITLSIIRNLILATNGADENDKLLGLLRGFTSIDLSNPYSPDFVTGTTMHLLKLNQIIATNKPEFEVAFNYVLGLLHTNHNIIRRKCISYLKTWFPDYKRVYPSFGTSSFSIFAIIDNKENLLVAKQRDTDDWIERIEVINFSLPQWVAESSLEERLDIQLYKADMCCAFEDLIEFKDIGQCILDETLRIVSCVGETNWAAEFKHQKVLDPLLRYLTKFSLNDQNLESLYSCALKLLLISSKPLLSTVLELLFSLKPKELNPYRTEIQQVNEKVNIENLQQFGVEVQTPIINEKHRHIVIPIISRILINRCRGSTKKFRHAVIRHVGSFKENEIQEYFSLAMGTWKTTKGDISPKHLEVRLNLIHLMMSTLRYKFPSLLEVLICGACDMVEVLSKCNTSDAKLDATLEEDSTLEENLVWILQQKRKAIKKARTSVLHYFEWFPKLNFTATGLEQIYDTFIWPAINDVLDNQVADIPWIFHLFRVWSSNQRYHILFTKYDSSKGGRCSSPIDCLLRILSNSATDIKVKIHILETLMNLMESETDKEDVILESIKPLFCASTGTGEESVGLGIILKEKRALLTALKDSQLFKAFCLHGAQRRLGLIAHLTEYIDDIEWNADLCGLLIKVLPFCKKNNDSLCYCLKSIEHTLKKVQDQDQLLMLLGPSFSWISGRQLRAALCGVLNSVNEKNTSLKEVLQGLNSWEYKANDTPDFVKRQNSYEAAKTILRNSFNNVFYTLVASNSFHVLHEIMDFGEYNTAFGILEEIAKHSPELSELQDMKKFIETTVLKQILKGLKVQDEKKFHGFLRVLNTYIMHCRTLHGTLAELSFLTDLGILEGLIDIKVHLRTRSMNRLCKALEDMTVNSKRISPAIVKSYIMPLAWHNLDNEEVLHDNRNELIDSSIQVLGNTLLLMPYTLYLTFLTELLNKPVTHPRLFKQRERILMTVMGAFHFNLYAAVREPSLELEVSVEEDFPGSQVMNINVLDKTSSTKCLQTLTGSIIPKLQSCLKLNQVISHKRAQARSQLTDDAPALKVPYTTALVKLLKQLPKESVSDALRPIVPSFCSYMKSKDHLVRDPVRKTLAMLLKELGSSHFPKIVNCLMAVLKRGYERHVLSYTISYLMQECEDILLANSQCVPTPKILKICEEELFGEMQSEKDVQAIKEKTREARKDNAGPIIERCAMLANDIKIIEQMIEIPLKTLQSEFTSNDKMIKNARHWLLSMHKGIVKNQNLPFSQILVLLHAKLTELSKINVVKQNKKQKKQKKSIYDIASIQKSHPEYPESTALVIEFIYDLLWAGLKNAQMHKEDCMPFVDNLLMDLDGATKMIEKLALRCLTVMFSLQVFDYAHNEKELVTSWNKAFLKMSTYCLSTSTDSEIVNAIFKFVITFLESFPDFQILVDDYKLMLRSIRCFLTQDNCSTNALNLLKKLVLGKFGSKELDKVIEEVQKQSITSHLDHIRDGCRQVNLEYIRNFCTTTTQCEEIIEFILEQFKYPESNGRLSAVTTLNTLIQILPEKVYLKNASIIFIKVILAIDHENSKEVSLKLYETFRTLLQVKSTVNMFLEQLCALVSDSAQKDSYPTLARVVALALVNCFTVLQESDKLDKFISFYESILTGTAWGSDQMNSEESLRRKDHAEFLALNGINELFQLYFIKHNEWSPTGRLERLCAGILVFARDIGLEHTHEWIPVKSLEFIHTILSHLSVNSIISIQTNKAKSKLKYCCLFETSDDITLLIRKLTKLLEQNATKDLTEPVIRNLKFLIQFAIRFYEEQLDVGVLNKCMHNLRHLITTEVTQNPDQSILRCTAYTMYSVLIEDTKEVATLYGFAKQIIRYCVRDSTDSNTPGDVLQIADQIMLSLKSKIGDEKYLEIHAKAQENIVAKRELNRAKKQENVILHPGLKRKRSANSGKTKKTILQHKKKRKL